MFGHRVLISFKIRVSIGNTFNYTLIYYLRVCLLLYLNNLIYSKFDALMHNHQIKTNYIVALLLSLYKCCFNTYCCGFLLMLSYVVLLLTTDCGASLLYVALSGIRVNLRKEFDQDQIRNFFAFFFHSNNILPRIECDN